MILTLLWFSPHWDVWLILLVITNNSHLRLYLWIVGWAKSNFAFFQYSKEKLAKGILVSDDPLSELDGVFIGPNYWKVYVLKANKPVACLEKTRQGVCTIGEAVGRNIAWRSLDVNFKFYWYYYFIQVISMFPFMYWHLLFNVYVQVILSDDAYSVL